MNNARRKQINALLATLKAVRETLADVQSAELLAARNADAEGPADSLSLAEQSLDETLNHLEDALRPD
jgi:hypothetical protein